MPEVWDIRQQQLFCQQLFAAAQDLIPNKPVSGNHVSVQNLATLTKLVVRWQETTRSLKALQPMIVVILSGTKLLCVDGQTLIFEAGDLLILPSNLTFDVINQPASTGEYIALVLELSTNLLNRVRQAYPEILEPLLTSCVTGDFSKLNLRVGLSPLLSDALIHLVRGTTQNENQSHILNEHYLIEVLLLLLQSNARQLLFQEIYPDFLNLVRSLIRSDLSAEWSLNRLAQALNMSVSTLKRRLQEAGLSFRQLLDEERMSRAMDLLTQNHQSVAQVALACGYESQSRFAARFRRYYSLNPSDVRSAHSGCSNSE
jgi:AraC-like DNA-binding protein